MNSVCVVGRLTRDPELRTTPGGTEVCSMRIAVDRAGERQDDDSYGAGFFEVAAFGRLAEVCAEYLEKGRQVAFVGSLRFSEWETDDGDYRTKVSISAREMTFVGSKDDDSSGGSKKRRSRDEDVDDDPNDDDIPF